jgi:hypothetical protein
MGMKFVIAELYPSSKDTFGTWIAEIKLIGLKAEGTCASHSGDMMMDAIYRLFEEQGIDNDIIEMDHMSIEGRRGEMMIEIHDIVEWEKFCLTHVPKPPKAKKAKKAKPEEYRGEPPHEN